MANAINFSDTTPAAPAGALNVTWQKDNSTIPNVSAYLTISNLVSTVGGQAVDVPPTSPGTLDDEFNANNGTVINAARWTGANIIPGVTAIQNSGWLDFFYPGTGGSVNNACIYTQSTPAGAWTVICKMRATFQGIGAGRTLWGGLVVYDGTKAVVFQIENTTGATSVDVRHRAALTSPASDTAAFNTSYPLCPTVWLKLANTGAYGAGNLVFSLSATGSSYLQIFSEANNASVGGVALANVNNVGILVGGAGDTTVTGFAHFDYFRRTA